MISRNPNADSRIEPFAQEMEIGARRMSDLQPKGTCWYCSHAVDNVRRFCSVTCRNDYFEEREAWDGGS